MRQHNEDSAAGSPPEKSGSYWVFGYGSLMWDPRVPVQKMLAGTVQGWHRRFSMVKTTTWGSPEKPGLAAGLHPGGFTTGFGIKIAAKDWAEAEAALDYRERHYLRRWVTLHGQDGRLYRALTYIAHPNSGAFLPDLPLEETRRRYLTGEGTLGSTRFYIEETARQLASKGYGRTDAHALLARLAGPR